MPPWELTPDMVLSELEVAGLLRSVRAAADSGDEGAFLDRFIVEALLFSGLRTSEFCRLRIADTAMVQPASVFVVAGGGGRIVRIPGHVSRLVAEYVRGPRARHAGPRPRPTDPLLLNERGHAYERTGLYRRVVRILAGVGLGERASVQLLRHTYGYLAYVRTGGNLLFVQRQLGHSHPMITSVYERLVKEDYDALAERVAAPPAESPPARRRKHKGASV